MADIDSELPVFERDNTSSFSFTAFGQSFDIDCNGFGTVQFQISGTWSGTISLSQSTDGINFEPSGNAYDAQTLVYSNSAFSTNGTRKINVVGAKILRLSSDLGPWDSGTADVTVIASPHVNAIDQIVGTITTVGDVRLHTADEVALNAGQQNMANSLPVVIASNQTAIPISAASLPLPTDASTEATLANIRGSVGAGVAATKSALIGAVFNTSLPTLTNGQQAALQLTSTGKLIIDGSSVTQPVSGTFWQATQPISAASLPLPTNASTSALQTTGNSSLSSIDTKTLAAGQAVMAASSPVVIASNQSAIPVSGTFFQVTQPVSAASLPLPIGAATSALQTQPGVDIGDVTINNASGASAVNIQDGGNSITVDGTVTATIAAAAATIAKAEDSASADGDVGVPAIAIRKATPANTSGTDGDYEILQMSGGRLWASATIDSALPAGSAIIGALVANQSVNNAQVGGVAVSTGNGVAGTGVQRVAIASDNTAFSVNAVPPTLTIGTQGATGFSVQPLKDAGRTAIIYYAVAVASGATGIETAITLTKSSGTSATSTGVSQTPTSGKRFRITNITFASRGNATATAQVTTFNVRVNTAGAVTTSSTPIVLSCRSATPATSSAWDRVVLEIPDGYEILGNGTLQFGVTANAVFTTNAPTWDVTIIGFEY